MPLDDTLAILGGADPGGAPAAGGWTGKLEMADQPPAAPPAQSGIDGTLAILGGAPAPGREQAAKPEPESAWSKLGGAGSFAATAAARGLGGLLDFATDPLSPVRRMISPDLERIEQSARPHPGETAGDLAFQATGIPEYHPTTPGGRIGLATAEGAVGGLPFGLVAGGLSGLGGLLGQGTQEGTGSERLATAASFLPAAIMPAARGAINLGIKKGTELLGPAMSEPYRRGVVGEQLRTAASDPEVLAQSLRDHLQLPNQTGGGLGELVPGSRPTTFQLSGDQGIGQLERGVRTGNPAPFLERAAEQNAARVAPVNALAPESANPGSVRDLLQQHLADITQQGDANVAAARQSAMQRYDRAGGQQTPLDMGALMRDQLEAAKASTKQRESALWRAIDPEGNLTINGTSVRDAANRIEAEIPRTAKLPEGEETAVLGFARKMGTAMPFSDFTALRGRLLQAIRDERENGQTPALRRMQQLRESMDGAISSAAENVAQQHEQAVSAGTMSPEQTLLQSLINEGQAHFAGRNVAAPAAFQRLAAGAGPTQGAGDVSGFANGVGRVSTESGGQSQTGGGPSNPSGASGLQGEVQPLANFDTQAAGRYREAADATRERAARFNNQVIGPALAERGNEYRLLESRLPERFISSTEGARAFLDAGGAPTTLHDALVGDLRRSATNPDGSINVNRYQSWINRRTDALGLFPDLRARLTDVANAQSTVDAFAATARQQQLSFQQGAARHFLNAEPTQAVQSALGGKNPVADMRELSRMVSGDPEAQAGLQRAVADYISNKLIGNTEAGTSGVNSLKSDQFQTFIKNTEPALSQVFSPSQLLMMRAVAADLQRSNRSVSGSKLPGQSNTMQDAAALTQSKASLLRGYLTGGAASMAGGVVGYLLGGLHGMAEGALGAPALKSAANKVQMAGLEKTNALLTEALLNPELAHTLLMTANPANRTFIASKLNTQLGSIIGAATASNDEVKLPSPTWQKKPSAHARPR